MNSVPSVLALLAGSSAAMAITFAPGTSAERVSEVQAMLRNNAPLTPPGRFSAPITREPFPAFLDPRETDPTERDYDIWWSYAPDGLAMEPSYATVFHANPGLRYGQRQEPLEPEDADFDNFQSSLFLNLNTLPRPFGFRDDGGQRTWQTIVKRAFDRWEQVSGIDFHFVPVGDGDQNDDEEAIADQPNGDGGGPWDRNAFGFGAAADGDIRIAMCDLDGASQPDGSTGTILAYTYDPDPALRPIEDFIDDNDTPDDLSDDIPTLGYAGNIILDVEEKWNDPATPNLFAAVIAREIGFALGMFPSCPSNPAEPYALLQEQITPFDTGVTTPGSNSPNPPLFFTEPQEDDIRAAHQIYGDDLEVFTFRNTPPTPDNPFPPGFGEANPPTAYSDAFDIVYRPVPNTNIFVFRPHLALPSDVPEFQDLIGNPRPVQLSINDDNDIDRFRIGIPDTVSTATMTITVTPRGTPYTNGSFQLPVNPGPPLHGACDNSVRIDIDPRLTHELRIVVESFDPFTNRLQRVEEATALIGESTEVSLPVSTGTYFISIDSPPPNNDSVQLYDMDFEVETPLLETGIESSRYLDQINISALRDEGYFGTSATIGIVEGQHPSPAHSVFAGRAPTRISWPGVQPGVTTSGSHATSTAGVAAGSPVGAFEGVAPEAEIVSSTVATEVFGDGTFLVGKNALYFALFSLADQNLSASLGLAQPAGVVLSSWGGGGRAISGEDAVSQAYDTAASMTGATFVVAAGNNGQFEGQSFPGCVITNPDIDGPGTDYLGSRSIIPPATAFNVISVGSVGFIDPITSPIEFQDQELVVSSFSGKGPIDTSIQVADGTVIEDSRAGVDILAPGSGVTRIPPDQTPDQGNPPDPCLYRGPEALSLIFAPTISPGDDPESPSDPAAFSLQQGTSVAASIVAGAVALLQDVAADQPNPLSTHPSVIKAILLNGATKLEGWNNAGVGPGVPQDQRNGFARNPALLNDPNAQLVYRVDAITANPLDPAQGTGVLDLQRSLENYLIGYAPAQPPQADFDGPTIDPPETDPGVPTIRMPDEPMGTGGPGAAAAEAELPPERQPPSQAELDQIRRANSGDEPQIIVGQEWQFVRDTDLKGGRGPAGTAFTTEPQTPFNIPSLGGGNGGGPGGGGPPQGPPGAIDPGARPREIGPIFVDPMGWDHGNIDQRTIRDQAGTGVPDGFIDYVIDVPLLSQRPDPSNPAGALLPADRLTVTLCWQRTFVLDRVNFSNPNRPEIGDIRHLEFENLDLELYPCDALGNLLPGAAPVRASTSRLSPTEHIFTDIPQSSLYLIRVRWIGTEYDVELSLPLAEQQYGIAWRVDFSPRPSALRPTGAADLVNVLGSYGSAVGNVAYAIEGDMNTDGRVNWRDLTDVLRHWCLPSAQCD